ncbi:MAG: small-conductance mechanosensitive ion channel, partial [Halothiobacillaceae bacterium]
GFIPNVVVALVIFIVGWVIGSLLGQVVAQIIRSLKIDNLLKSAKVDEVLKRGGFNLDSGRFLGALVEWFVIIVFLVAALDVLKLTQVNAFLRDVVLLYLPQVIVAVLILLAAVVIAAAMQRLVVGAAQAAGVRSANFLGSVTKWAIWVFAVLMALFQLGIAAPFVQTLFTGLIVALSLAFGLSFGLGGQQAAASFLDKVRDEIKNPRG